MREPEWDDPDDPIRWIGLRPEAYGGPFRYQGGIVGGDFETDYEGLGLSRELYDEVMAWNEDYVSLRSRPSEAWQDRHFARKQRLLTRLRDEVHPGIQVEAPQASRPTEVALDRMRPGPTAGELVLGVDTPSSPTGEGAALVLGVPLAARVLIWVEEGRHLSGSERPADGETLAWQDAGSELARQVQGVLGRGYAVVLR